MEARGQLRVSFTMCHPPFFGKGAGGGTGEDLSLAWSWADQVDETGWPVKIRNLLTPLPSTGITVWATIPWFVHKPGPGSELKSLKLQGKPVSWERPSLDHQYDSCLFVSQVRETRSRELRWLTGDHSQGSSKLGLETLWFLLQESPQNPRCLLEPFVEPIRWGGPNSLEYHKTSSYFIPFEESGSSGLSGGVRRD